MKLYETITAENWHKGGLVGPRRPDGTYSGCLLFYIYDVLQLVAVEAAIKALYAERSPTGNVARFNDHPDTVVDDVLRVCKFADV